eukprot:TRINITY_DN123915_c0_g1_i1.p1 TRINITY_DN123915_c0_g1~~TRINITY_DN123915_c0_g1_i1.p1  ORF type:complete len:324 (+),score=36.74 TRINITY_DN123915_c0_g1_i1:40-1011(+)
MSWKAFRGEEPPFVSPAEECVKLSPTCTDALGGSFSKLSVAPLTVFAATLGPVALGRLRTASVAYSNAFHSECFVATTTQREKWNRLSNYDSEVETESFLEFLAGPDLDDEDNLLAALDAHCPEALNRSALDDIWLSLRRKSSESPDDYHERIRQHTFNSVLICDAGALSETCRCALLKPLMPVVFGEVVRSLARSILHGVVISGDLQVAKMVTRAVVEAGCNRKSVFGYYRNTWTQISPLFLCMVICEQNAFEHWVKLLVTAGARLNKIDKEVFDDVAERVLRIMRFRSPFQELERRLRFVVSQPLRRINGKRLCLERSGWP